MTRERDGLRTFRVAHSLFIRSSAEKVYSILSDYHRGHPKILPPRYFSDLVVEEGGIGAGTRIRFVMTAFGRRRNFRAAITELVPGRTLVETDLDSGAVTTFNVLSVEKDQGCHVSISTEIRQKRGIAGMIERTLTSKFLRTVYAAELQLLKNIAEGGAAE